MVDIDFARIEKKWQGRWAKEKVFEVDEKGKNKYYVLEMFTYPSGSGLHMGHAFNFVIGDVFARFKIMNGYNVLHPVGYDALGLPAENAAIKVGTHPEDYTKRSIPNFMKQQKALGLSYDWSRMINTAGPSYYKWDQWIFLKMLEKGLAYQKESAVNWCPKCDSVLANEQVKDGKCWIHDSVGVEVRNLKQWFLKTTEYADELYEGLDKMDWPEKTKAMQRNWIGRSYGTEIDFLIESRKSSPLVERLSSAGKARSDDRKSSPSVETWSIFTTRPDTIFGVTFMVVSAQHSRLGGLVTDEQRKDVDKFLKRLKSVKDVDKLDKEGVFSGSYAVNPVNGEKVPVWIGNFVVADYGCGMVMAVPAHDQRDFDFAKKYGIEIRQVIAPLFVNNTADDSFREDKNTVERNAICAIVKHWKEDKYFCLDWKKLGWKTSIIGGIDKGESAEEAVVREVKEETGYQDVKSVKKIGIETHASFFARHKDENRYGRFNTFIVELGSGKFVEPEEEHVKNHVGVWVDKKNVKDFFNLQTHSYAWENYLKGDGAYTGEGVLINSGEFDKSNNDTAKDDISKWLGKKGVARKVVNFKLRDWGISRQRYWGTPIPVIHCEKCGAVPVAEKDLPVKLPKKVKFGKGNPLESAKDWISVKCPKCGGAGKRETDTMDTFVNSSWYFLRFCDAHNDKKIFDKKKVKYWCPVDMYIGGAEHACMHLIYSRFYVKFLRDIGLVDFDEPAVRLFHQGMINDDKGEKMSKSKGNIVEPLEMMGKYGVDVTRYFLLSVASPDKGFDWSEKGVAGSLRFVRKVVDFYGGVKVGKDSKEMLSKLNEVIKGVGEDVEMLELRTVTIRLRELFDLLAKHKEVSKGTLESALKMFSLFCPHVAEEIWERIGGKGFISVASWPKVDKSKLGVRGKVLGVRGLNDGIVESVNYVLGKVGSGAARGVGIRGVGVSGEKEIKKVFVYVVPFELGDVDVKRIAKEVGKDVEVFAVNDSGKYDPDGKAKRAKPGRASVYIEQ